MNSIANMHRWACLLLLVLCGMMICGEVFAARSWWEKLLQSNPELDQKEHEAELLQTPEGKLAKNFAQMLVDGRFDVAHKLLSRTAQAEWPVAALEKTYRQMVAYFVHPPSSVVPTMAMRKGEMPNLRNEDVAWVYTAIAADGDHEAVTIIITKENDAYVIRWLEWGRP